MVIAHFDRTQAVVFFLLAIVAVMVAFAGSVYMVWDDWTAAFVLFPVIFWVFSIPCSILAMMDAIRNSRGVWIEDGTLHFFESLFDELIFIWVTEGTVPLDSIAGLSSFEVRSSGAVGKKGIYVDLKSGKSRKILTFLLRDPEDVVMARLRAALDHMPAKL